MMVMRALSRGAAPAAARRMLADRSHQARTYSLSMQRVTRSRLDQQLVCGASNTCVARFSDSASSTSANGEAAASEGEAVNEEAEEAAADSESEPAPPTPEETIARLEAELKDKHDHMVMAYANEQNALRIAKDDIAKARDFAVQSFAKSLLDVADNLHRAMDAVPTEAVEAEGNEMLKQLLEGVKLTENGLLKAFTQHGVVKYGTVGDKFDANVHEAMYMYKDPTAEPGTLGQVLQEGYMLKSRCLRPAKAGIVDSAE